jgi:hypothetical protein
MFRLQDANGKFFEQETEIAKLRIFKSNRVFINSSLIILVADGSIDAEEFVTVTTTFGVPEAEAKKSFLTISKVSIVHDVYWTKLLFQYTINQKDIYFTEINLKS